MLYFQKILLAVILTLVLPQSLFSQNYLIQENFNNCTVPNNWVNYSLGSGWNIGTAAALESSTFPIPSNGSCIAVVNDASIPGNNASVDVLIMPKIDITGINNLILQFDMVKPIGPSHFYIEYSHDSINWNTGYQSIQALSSPSWQNIEYVAHAGLFQGGNDLWLRLRYKDFGFATIGIAIDNLNVYEPGPNDLKLTSLTRNEWSEFGSQDISGQILNYGNNTINYYTLNWQLNNGPISSQLINSFTCGSFLNPFVPSGTEKLNAYSFTTAGNYELKVWTSLPNGMPDTNPSNDTIITIVNAAVTLPEKRVLLEKYTHTYCGPCYPADIHFDLMLSDHPFVSGASIHAAPNDPYTIPDGNTLDDTYTYAHPTFVADRKILGTNSGYRIDQYLGETDDLNLAVEDLQAVSVSITNFNYNQNSNTIQLEVEAYFYGDYTSDLGINAYVLEDSVLGYQAGAPAPNNYYHNHVVRGILGGSWGSPFQMSDVIGGTYSKTFTYSIPPGQNPDHFTFIGFVQKINTDIPERHIINCTPEIHMEDAISLAIPENGIENTITVFPNPFNSVFKIDIGNTETVHHISIHDLTGKLIYKNESYMNLSEIDLSAIQSGAYVLTVELTDKKRTHTLIVKE